MGKTVKVMSFNIRVAIGVDGANEFCYRAPKIKKMIDKESPDIICFQEITPKSREWCVENLNNYYIVGCGRNADYMGEQVIIAYKKCDLFLVSCETKTLSPSPYKFGTRYEGVGQSEYPRIYTKAFFKHKDIDKPFYVYNIHTDHLDDGSLIRTLEVGQLLSDICANDSSFVLCGDFNARPNSNEIKMITACSSRKIIWATDKSGSTSHDFGRRDLTDDRYLIDYIFTDGKNCVVKQEKIEDLPENGVYLSDHYPIYAVLEIN